MGVFPVPGGPVQRRSSAAVRPLLVGGFIAAAALLVFNPPWHIPITGIEARWLVSSPGLARALVDAWTGVTDDRMFRFPIVLVCLLASCATAILVTRAAGLFAGTLAGLAMSAQIYVLSGPYLVGSTAPLALASATLVLATLSARIAPARCAALLLLAALLLAMLEPGLGAAPLGAALGIAGSRSSHRTTLARALSIACAILLLALLIVHPQLPWAGESGGRLVVRFETIFLAVSLGVIMAAAWRREGAGSARVTTGPARAGDGPDPRAGDAGGRAPELAGLALLAAAMVWLLTPRLRSLTQSPLTCLLFVAAPLAIVIASRAWPWPPGTGGPRVRPLAGITIALCAWPLIAWSTGRERPAAPLPLTDALAAMHAASPATRELLAGPGLTRGVLSHAARRLGLCVTSRPKDPVIGMVALAAAAPTLPHRDAIATLLGDRVLDRYGIVGAAGPTLRWSLFRPLAVRAAAGGARPNIAIISVDTLRADHLSFYGYGRETSPRLGRFASHAIVYDNATAAAPSTAPSFASIMTGRLPVAHGVRRNYEFLDPGNWTLSRVLRKGGYETAGFVSSYVLSAGNCGLDLGFDTYDEQFDQLELNRLDRPIRLAPALSSSVLQWLRARRPEAGPWFLWVHAIDPHGPYTPLTEFADAFRSGPDRAVPRDKIPSYQWLGTTSFQRYVDGYDGEILQTDEYLGRVVEAIEALPSPQGTIIVFVADHGEAFGEHGVYFDHGHSLHVEEIQVPLVIEDTARPAAGRAAGPVSTLDVMPTLLARLGIETDLPFDGKPLGERAGAGSTVLANWTPGEVMASRGRWKLIVRPGAFDRPVTSVYDTMKDPREVDPLPLTGAESDPWRTELVGLGRDAGALIARDPLTPQLGIHLDREQWQMLESEAQEKLKSLGYAAQ